MGGRQREPRICQPQSDTAQRRSVFVSLVKFAPTDERRKILERSFLAKTRHSIKINLRYDFGRARSDDAPDAARNKPAKSDYSVPLAARVKRSVNGAWLGTINATGCAYPSS